LARAGARSIIRVVTAEVEPVEGQPQLVGREVELDGLGAWIDDRGALPAALVIEGLAGSGKTTLWRATIERARMAGYRILACRPAGAEIRLAYSAISDLLEPHVAHALPGLPTPQRRALEITLLLRGDEGTPPDRRTIAAGFLNAIRLLARERAVLLAIDDGQWLDDASAEVLEYAARRLGSDPVAILASWRRGSPIATVESARPDLRLDVGGRRPIRLEVGPLSLGALNRLLRTRTDLAFNRRMLQRIHETSGGNPFYALELAHAMRGSEAGASETEPLPLGRDLGKLLAGRLDGLPDETREALFVAAAMGQPTVEAIAAASARAVEDIDAAIRPAVRDAIVRVNGETVEFSHPLLAAAAYAAIDPAPRRDWHARIAVAAQDLETRARHAALARPGRNAEVARLLHAAARAAQDRGAPGVAADLFAEAIERLPAAGEGDPGGQRAAWILEAAPILRSVGAIDRARTLVESALAELPRGPERSEGLRLLADLVENEPGGGKRAEALLDRAIVEAGSDARRRARALLDREMMERSTARLDLALPIAGQALEAAEESGDIELQAFAHVRTADLEILLGLGGDDPVARFERAVELDRQVRVDTENSAPVMLAVCLIRVGRLDEARPRLLEGRRRAMAEGDEASHAHVCLFLAELEWLAGGWDEAAAFAAEGLETAEQAGLRMRVGSTGGLVALVEASRGDPERARATAEAAIAHCDAVDDIGYARYGRQVLAFLDLSLGNAEAAARSLDTYVVGHAIEGPKRIAFIGDAIEALVRRGEVDRAAGLVDEVAERGARLLRPPLVAVAARCRALVLASRGDLESAEAAGRGSVEAFERLGQPFERARSLLVLGEVLRRAKRRRDARATLTDAIEAFDRLGAHLWSTRASAERARVGGRSTVEGLTETELRVARLVAEGRSNKEVAAELFVTVRAVEANLSKVYAKLGVRSRTELARRL
jgi:DNA-binding NarL/FixJ family response regulator